MAEGDAGRGPAELPPETALYRHPPQFRDGRRAPVQSADEKRVWYAALMERCLYDQAAMRLMQVSAVCGSYGFQLIGTEYGRTDETRNLLARAFLLVSRRPDDTLVMLDVDHAHPKHVVPWLAQHNVEVVTPLIFRRGPPYQACAFRADAQGGLHHLETSTMAPGLHRMDGGVGTGAIAIQRRVFEKLAHLAPHYFRYEYDPLLGAPSEDMFFCKHAAAAGVEMWVDTVFESPHLALGRIDRDVAERYQADHPGEAGRPLTIAEIDQQNQEEPIYVQAPRR